MVEEKDRTLENDFSFEENKSDYRFQMKRKRKWWWLLLLLIPLLLLLLVLRECNQDNPTPPIVGEEDLTWDKDSLTKIVNNRIILLFSEDRTVEEFVKDFRKLYPDKKKYQLYIPDDMLPRIVLTLPKDELDSMSERLPGEFVKYDLMVIPEAVFENGRTFNDPVFTDKLKSWYFDMISVQVAWDITTGSPDVVVAVLDDGFDLKHPELQDKSIVLPYNSVHHNNKVSPNPGSGHGTHVASTVVGKANNGEGSAGIAPDCKLMPIQVANENGIITTSSLVDGVLYAIKSGADVVNMSLGQEFNPILALLPDEAQMQIIQTNYLTEERMWRKIFGMGMKNGKDMAFVLAGGNENMLIGVDPMQRIEGTIRVSAVQPNKRKANFSNYGAFSDLSAPGVDIYNAVSGSKKYDTYSGTSMASPIVSGAFALLKSAYPNMRVAEITKMLQHTGIPSPSRVGNIVNFAYAFNYLGSNPISADPETPKNPEYPTDPSNLNDVLNPNNPQSPINPHNPNSPINPNNPSSPINNPEVGVNPQDPEDPYCPSRPDSPFNPENPNSPVNPYNPNSPLNPDYPGSPFNPNNPGFVSDPNDPNSPFNPRNPSSPLNPNHPDSPFNPQNPDSPINPTSPYHPGNPLNPHNPDSPLNPHNPDSPLNPQNPSSPINPRNPSNPIDPSNPYRNKPLTPNNPFNPYNPTSPFNPNNPRGTFNPSNPNSLLNPNNPNSLLNPANPDSPLYSSDPGQNSDPRNPNSPFNPRNPNSPFNPKNPVSPLNPNYPGNILNPQPMDPSDPCPDCTEAQKRYEELMRQLEELKRNNPDCY